MPRRATCFSRRRADLVTDLAERPQTATRVPGQLGAVHPRYRTDLSRALHQPKPAEPEPDTAPLTVVFTDQMLLANGGLDVEGDDYEVAVLVDPEQVEALLRREVDDDFNPGDPNDPLQRLLEFRVAFKAGPGILAPPRPRPVKRPTPFNDWLIKLAPPPSWPTTLFWAAVALALMVRYLVLASGGAPATIDSGNWLAFCDEIFGDGSRDSSITYPPLVPALASILTSLFGVASGIAVLGALSSLAPGLGVYRALGMVGLGRERVFPAVLLIGAGSVSDPPWVPRRLSTFE